MKKHRDYVPNPIDTQEVVLGAELVELCETLAKNAHDNWASQRIRDGWSYGPARDDAAKRHPCLVPYEELPESEKAYDRLTVMETIKCIVALGYRVEAKP